jgi:hypothetical protein
MCTEYKHLFKLHPAKPFILAVGINVVTCENTRGQTSVALAKNNPGNLKFSFEG